MLVICRGLVSRLLVPSASACLTGPGLGMTFNRIILLLVMAGLSACAANQVRDSQPFKLDSLVSIDGKQLESNGHFQSPAVVMIYSHICADCVEALNRFGDWIIPELKDLDVAYIGIGRGHTANDLKLWQNEDHIALDLVADPRYVCL